MTKKNTRIILCPDSPMGYAGITEIHSDVNGSYTGRPESDDEIPVQDADDL